MKRWKVRVDTGGTFTDGWALDSEGVEHRCKILSDGRMRLRLGAAEDGWREIHGVALPDGLLDGWRSREGIVVEEHRGGRLRISTNPDAGVIELSGGEEAPVVVARLLTGTPSGAPLPAIDFRVATTRGTNALLELKGARLAFFVTAGFEDLLAIRDQRREALFALEQPELDALAARVIGVAGRLAVDGAELAGLSQPEIREAARRALADGCTSAAVALLHAWKNPVHEQRIGEWLRAEGFEHVTLSSAVAPVIRLLPRAETAVTDAFLAPVMRGFIERVSAPLGGTGVRLMTSAGGLTPAERYLPKDSLLSGPAGGLIGAAELGRAAGFDKLLTFDMGGTSTDVARIDGPFSYRQEQQIGPARVIAPALTIETVAAGGGSIVGWHDGRLEVGPESAGSEPGPACYGRGGPLTLTDVNLLLGLMDPEKAGIPLDRRAAEARFAELREAMGDAGSGEGLLEGIRAIGIEKMAEAIRSVSVREGVPVGDHALLAFGGAGPQHACAIASHLGVGTVLVPGDAGLLSAWGLDRAVLQEQRVGQVLAGLDEVESALADRWRCLADEAAAALGTGTRSFRWLADLRLVGQDSTLEIESPDGTAANLREDFAEAYQRLFGYAPPVSKAIEVVSLRVVVEETAPVPELEQFSPESEAGPLVFQDRFSTCVVPAGWVVRRGSRGTLLLEYHGDASMARVEVPAAVRAGLFRSRFEGLLAAMGEALRRTSLSTNVKERLDFSCALLDADGRLVASAPHVPVHLGALGVCVRETVARLSLRPGEVAITNHPAAGGSHLPDVTLIAPVHVGGELIGYVANRAHHAELGGKAPGSMPADATCLAEEGVVIPPMRLVRDGEVAWAEIESLLRDAPYPSRRTDDNLADIAAQLAACHFGRTSLAALAEAEGAGVVKAELVGIIERSAEMMGIRLAELTAGEAAAGTLDDGSPLAVALEIQGGRMRLDFSGTGGVHPRNLNATPAIVRSVALYVLRLWIGEDIALNEGLLEPVELVVPAGLLNPPFGADDMRNPAVVGGNVEISQRLTDLMLEVFGLAANGPGTMNNFLFGDERRGYYETLGGGSGAGPGFHGASGRQVHMTNTALTDPEVLEHRYPVRVRRHEVRRGSGGRGEFTGGDGVIREIRFLAPLTVSFLTQRRVDGPRGMRGGADGAPGAQFRLMADGRLIRLPSSCTYSAGAGEGVRIETPGGGGWGERLTEVCGR